MVERPLDHLGADAESLQAARAAAPKIVQPPTFRIDPCLEADAPLNLGPAKDGRAAVVTEDEFAAVDLRLRSDDGPGLSRKRHKMRLVVLRARCRQPPPTLFVLELAKRH